MNKAKTDLTWFERIMFIFGWVRLEDFNDIVKGVEIIEKELASTKMELEALKAKTKDPLSGLGTPNVVPTFPTKGKGNALGFGGFFGSLLQSAFEKHDRKDIYKDEHVAISTCSGCDPCEMVCSLTGFTVDRSAEMILQSIPDVEDVSCVNKSANPVMGEYNCIRIMFEDAENMVERAKIVAEKLKTYLS